MRISISCCLVLPLLLVSALLRTSDGSDVITGGFVDSDECQDALYLADENGDGQVVGDEYVTVVQMLGPPGFLEDAETFEDLPRILRQSFNLLACLCSIVEDDENCCIGDNAHLSNAGTGPGETPTPDQEVYLFSVCLTTERAIQRTIETSPPTVPPSVLPSSTPAPSLVPTRAPITPAPATPAPTTSAPITPEPTSLAPVTEAPVTDSPVTPAPSTVAPVTPAPVTPAPITIAPVTPAPVTPAPVTPAPVTPAPVTPAPVTPAPVTPAPVTPAPVPTTAPTTAAPIVTPSPITAAPVTPAPTTSAPVTDAPVPTLVPTTAAPTVPTAAPVSADFPVIVEYEVAFRNNVEGSYVQDLGLAMDVLAPQVVADTFLPLRLRRRLTVDTRIPTVVISSLPSDCPEFINDDDECQTIRQSITLIIVDQNVDQVEEDFIVNLNEAISDGKLQRILDEINPDSTVYIVSGLEVGPTAAPSTAPGGATTGLSSGATAGIAIAAVAAIALFGGALYIARKHNQADKDEETYFPGTETQALSSPDVDGDLGDGTLGATQGSYRIKSKSAAALATLEEGGVADKAAPTAEKGPDQSSDAGSSGWSSSAGVSSLNTGSIDSIEGDSVLPGARLSAIVAGSALAGGRRDDRDRDDEIPDMPDISRGDLDTAIEAGDWAAVGATAALLAAASDSQSYSSRSRRTDTSMSRGGSSVSSMDAARAAELDHLVDAGDWEGVVVAAAKFEASEDTSTGASNTSKTGGSSPGHSQASTSLSESPSKLAKRDEIREEVENLVRRVVPEEIDNVDEMMMQFKGREEELVETLRTMQERQVAQKARVQGQKQAKRDARQTSRDGGLALPVPGPGEGGGSSVDGGVRAAAGIGVGVAAAAAAGIAAAVGAASSESDSPNSDSPNSGSPNSDSLKSGSPKNNSPESVDSSSGSSSDQSESAFAAMAVPSILDSQTRSRGSPSSSVDSDAFASKKRRTQLELAIEAGDWEAVGEAAAMMSDASVNSASTGEIDRIAGGDTSTYSVQSSENRYQVNAERASELDDMIDQGDWTGVVAAASRFSSADTSLPSTQDGTATSSEQTDSLQSTQLTLGSRTGTITSGTSASTVEGGRLKEEQEALAQAEIWMAIAEQSKTEGEEDAGASDAADWAIARSLSALKSAEAKGELEKSSSDNEDSDNSGGSV